MLHASNHFTNLCMLQIDIMHRKKTCFALIYLSKTLSMSVSIPYTIQPMHIKRKTIKLYTGNSKPKPIRTGSIRARSVDY